jgi:predicted AlkP superfamily phosphohydrolase/phosphomutase
LNVSGREPQGIVGPEEVEPLLRELEQKLQALGDEQGRPIGTRTFRPNEVYRACNNVPPDLIVYFGDLNWRSVGSVGHPSVWTYENDTGPDDANHAQFGIFLMGTAADMQRPGFVVPGPQREGLSLFDIAPTILTSLGLAVPQGVGRTVVSAQAVPSPDTVYTEDEEAELARRLEDLGYL